MAWELIFMLLLLKIPLFYLCGVVWWAIKAEPVADDAPGDLAPVREPRTPLSPPAQGFGARRGPVRRDIPARFVRRASRTRAAAVRK